ncbi:PREDICTED: SET and MYND domain-containing protein 4 [Rhagoletis zephyria]|uniref:SET and MYND domain-containing protein 4 n=1 Tax=Rhagoletis zephyria TaxID=28612 RepID=UPI000811457A|nr:PREDICTED: SET and MYND domain-containing protein 4 [Rhagoletis zephyria]
MDGFSFPELLSYQAANTKVVTYGNEFQFMLAIKNDVNFPLRRRMSAAWLSALKAKYALSTNDKENAARNATRLREEGNVLYSSKTDNNKGDMVTAGQRYTQAIFAAVANTEPLALAYANRAMALQELKYYQQAYDDCCCVLETNMYPPRLLHKIIARQAFCAFYLKDAMKLEAHLQELKDWNLNESFTMRVQELHAGLEILNNNERQKQTEFGKEYRKEVSMTEATRIIDTKSTTRGRYMIATREIKSGEVIFSETASSFVPVGGCQMCQECGAMLMIPFPCHGCNGKVIYCSLACRKGHFKVHQNECIGHLIGLFAQIGISHLALRVVLEEMPAIVPIVEHKKDPAELWLDLTSPKGLLHTRPDVNYAQTLCMVTHLAKMSLSDIIWFALVAELLIVYLKDHTHFFKSMNSTNLKQTDWELITSALILRHIGQFIVNAHTCVSITPSCYDVSSTGNLVGLLLVPNVWVKPFHLRRGLLHMFSEFREVSAANLSYLSICNHACAPTLCPKFSGRNFYALAVKDIETGAEIFNCYTLNHRKSLRTFRQSYLKDTYHFDCICAQCQQKNPDSAYLKYHLYKCQNPKCQKEFVPDVDNSSNLIWWLTVYENQVPLEGVACTKCKKKWDIEWFREFKELLKQTNSVKKRVKLLRIFKTVDDFLLGFHSLKLTLASELVNACIISYTAGCEFIDEELNEIVRILKFCLEGTADQCGLQSIEYVATMTYMWDLIAIGKCQCTQLEKNSMLKALDIISDEYRIVFINYYKDYIDKK